MISIRKGWALDPTTAEQVVAYSTGILGTDLAPTPTDDLPLVRRLLNVVRFRYLPNHVHPGEILIAEESAIRRLLFDRLGKRQALETEAMDDIAEVASELVRPIKEAMQRGTGDDRGRAVAVDSAGRVVVAGYSHNGSNDDFAVVRYTSSGALDASFSSDGKVTTDFAVSWLATTRPPMSR